MAPCAGSFDSSIREATIVTTKRGYSIP